MGLFEKALQEAQGAKGNTSSMGGSAGLLVRASRVQLGTGTMPLSPSTENPKKKKLRAA
jgi:hypothetical protein